MAEPHKLLTADEIIYINQSILQKRKVGFYVSVGGNETNPGTLEAMLEECQGVYFGEERYPSIIDKAAMIAWRIVKGHIFRDGCKRTAEEACRVTLQLNGYNLIHDKHVIRMFRNVGKGKVSLEDFTEWLAHIAIRR